MNSSLNIEPNSEGFAKDSLVSRSYNNFSVVKTTPNLRSSKFRWLFLAFTCLNCVGSYFCYDNPQALQTHLLEDFKIDTFRFNLLYSVYALPNIVLPLFGGIIVDRLGVRFGISFFSFLVIIGQSVVTFGAKEHSFILMLIGRIIFGFGGECLAVASGVITAKWFRGREIAFALGLILCISRLGSALNSFLAPRLYNISHDVFLPLFFGAILCIFSWIMGLLMNHLDRKADGEYKVFVDEGEEAVEKFKFDEIKSFNGLYYLLLVQGFFLYASFYGLSNNINDLMVARFGFDPDTAGQFIPIIYLSAAAMIPIFGLAMDYYGKRALLMIFSALLFMGIHLTIAFLPGTNGPDPDYSIVGCLFGIGIFYSTFAATYWPCIPIVVEERLTATAYGVSAALQNLMLTLTPLALGTIHDRTIEVGKGYFWTEITLMILVACGLVATVLVYFVDIKTGGILHKPLAIDKRTVLKASVFFG